MLEKLLSVTEDEGELMRLFLCEDGSGVLVLGYRMELTPSEYLILHALYNGDVPMRKGDFERECGVAGSSVPVHVANINKKAYPITGRRLIEYDKSLGYKISDTM